MSNAIKYSAHRRYERMQFFFLCLVKVSSPILKTKENSFYYTRCFLTLSRAHARSLTHSLSRFPFLPLFLSPLLQMLACQNEASVSAGSRKDTDAKLPHPHLDMVIS